MKHMQADLFAQDEAERNRLSDEQIAAVRDGLEKTLARLEAADKFPWEDQLEAALEENRFEYRAGLLGEEGKSLWARFDKEMERLFASLN